MLDWLALCFALIWVAIAFYVQYLDWTNADVAAYRPWRDISLYLWLITIILLFISAFRRGRKPTGGQQ